MRRETLSNGVFRTFPYLVAFAAAVVSGCASQPCACAKDTATSLPAERTDAAQTSAVAAEPPAARDHRKERLAAAERVLNEQGDDPSWSRSREVDLSTALLSMPDAGITSVDVLCARTLCRIRLKYQHPDKQATVVHHLTMTGLMSDTRTRFSEDFDRMETTVYASRPGFDLPTGDGTVRTMEQLRAEGAARRARSRRGSTP